MTHPRNTCPGCGGTKDARYTLCRSCARPVTSARLLRYDAKHPGKRQARAIANRALQAGVLRREPCEYCGDIEVQMHHDDYSQPLAVRWLCRECHRAIERAREL